MLHKKCVVRSSELHGAGLFAEEDISKGEVVYTASPLLDVDITQEQFDSLDEREQEQIKYWGFWDEPNNVWHVDFDISKFINHANSAALSQDETYTDAYLVATRDIKKGEELTQNYLEFESEEDLKARGINI